ncbi:MAG: hypothetical protein EZS28_013784 [Streblomastix strix]|uniref:Uncharacterized protein n=1 Tax=Streblomastix strix TaxID=222440 RepID=A0A5J4W8H3_9EUKA|nr:MAG: hypothetical protein EZS28_013784 [Streblomastix strix]
MLTPIEFARSRTNFNGTKTATTALAVDIKYATQKEQAIICSNSLSDLTVNNCVTVSPLESTVQGKRHCGVFIDVALVEVAAASSTTEYFYRYPKDITFSGVMDLNQLNPIFNKFPVQSRNYALLYLQLWMTDFLQDLKVVWLNKSRSFDTCSAYAMIPAEKSDTITLLDNSDPPASEYYAVRLINCRDLGNADTDPKNSIQQLDTAYFDYLSIYILCFTMDNEMAIIDMIRAQKIIYFPTQVLKIQSTNYPMSGTQMQTIMSFSNIKSVFMTFAMQQYPTWFFPLLMKKIDLVIDQKHATPNPYEALTADVNGSIFQCFVDQDIVSAPSDLYRSLTFENININDQNYQYATKTYYPNKFMLAWKLATDDSFMRGYNNNFKVLETDPATTENQNNFAGFIGTRSYPISTQIAQTLLVHFLCDSIVRIMFDDAPEPQVLNLEVIGEIGGSMIVAG